MWCQRFYYQYYFRCVEDEGGSLILHYYSARTGLYPIVIGKDVIQDTH